MTKQFYTVKEVADLFNVTKQTVHNWERNGKINSIKNKLNNMKYYNKNIIDDLFKQINVLRG